MTKEQALKQLREARAELIHADEWIFCYGQQAVILGMATRLKIARKEAYNHWIAAVQTFNQIVRGQ